jgi:Fe-S oxidoreductase
MEIKNHVFILVFAAAIYFFWLSCKRLIKYLSIGQKENRAENIPARIKKTLKIAFLQSKLLREPVAGFLHFLIFWGFLLFLFTIAETIAQGFYSGFSLSFLGAFYSVMTFVSDIFAVLVIVAIGVSLFRRFIIKIPRLDVEKAAKKDAFIILSLILIVVVSMLGQNSADLARAGVNNTVYGIRPVSALISPLFCGSGAGVYYEVFWWTHIVSILFFLNYLPHSKHLHVLTSIPNVFFSKADGKKGALSPLNLEDENAETFGVSDVDQLTWKQLLDGFTCTECGRCTAACPAAISGKSLSPKKIITDIRRRTFEKAPLIINNKTNGEFFEKTLLNNYISEQELWQCTTCGACVQECPVTIEHIDAIVDMRRNLTLTESRFPQELNSVFRSFENNFSPWAFNQAERADWAEGLNIKTMAEDNNCELLFWVGCSGAFDIRYKKVTIAFAKLLQKADIDFRILGTEEKCTGDTARRLGNEYLAQTLIKENVETLNNYNVKKIVTACPHCFNSIKNEFRQFGGNYEVIHHSEFIEQLVSEGKIEMEPGKNTGGATYHDSCYLGRYNDIYDAPRNVLGKIYGAGLVEMERNKSRGFCCGAGGGRMFLEDVEGERINVVRAKEALQTNAKTIASACPFCMTMLNDGVKAFDKQDEIEVRDIAEIVLENSK